jgi:hypothetical protein
VQNVARDAPPRRLVDLQRLTEQPVSIEHVDDTSRLHCDQPGVEGSLQSLAPDCDGTGHRHEDYGAWHDQREFRMTQCPRSAELGKCRDRGDAFPVLHEVRRAQRQLLPNCDRIMTSC